MKTPNERIVTLKLTRHEVCDLIVATCSRGSEVTKWGRLHDKIKQTLEEHDAKTDVERDENR